MDMMSAEPVHLSSLEANDLEDLSADEEDDGDEPLEDEIDSDVVETLRDRFIAPRFKQWLAKQQAKDQVWLDLIHEMYGRLVVLSREVETQSSERHLTFEFTLLGMAGRYTQCSQADPRSATWDVSKGSFRMLPNLEAELILDGEALARCTHFAVPHAADVNSPVTDDSSIVTSGNQQWTDDVRISERFGSDNLATLGGIAVLLQFLGIICADEGAACYAEVLPFNISAEHLQVPDDEIAPASFPSKESSAGKDAQASRVKPSAPRTARPSSRGTRTSSFGPTSRTPVKPSVPKTVESPKGSDRPGTRSGSHARRLVSQSAGNPPLQPSAGRSNG